MAGRLLGIARHDRPKGAIETIAHAQVTPERGVEGDFRGALKPGRNKRQVTVMALADWQAALDEVKGEPLDWSVRRANLLVDGVALPHMPGARIAFAGGLVLEVTGETEPCERMDAIRPGLRAALTPEWRGGVTTRVIAGGSIAIGDEVRIDRP